MKSTQQGVALITAMLIVAIIATLATSLALGQQVWLRQTQNLVDLAQAEQLRQGAYEYAAAVLVRDEKSSLTNKSDNLQEAWAQSIPPLPVEGGVVLISIRDAQARFNLNNLVQQGKKTSNATDIAIFRNLLQQNDLPTDLADALIDWMDTDPPGPEPKGAEDLDYLNLDPPYRVANQPLQSIDELRLIKGYKELSGEDFNKLAGLVVVLPEAAPINVNTADAAVLAALLDNNASQAKLVVQARENDPVTDKKIVQSLFPANAQPNAASYDVKSKYFIVTVETRIGRIQRRTEALIERSFGNATKADVVWYRQPPISFTLDEDKS
jgi:general secretion pathway protein K